ncbi:hypothetical protein PVL29_006786 [Vitis rotundifolia]|uniref:Uncharacterized protein n=1 Tax=Vitis rotundifolia TaxID=103349 RepID=A0AA39A7Y5_VITRO|nr:hypothetical protein PVL29_006786 [Vitis rotundifolia]
MEEEAMWMFDEGRDEELALSRVLEKLYVLMIQEPIILVGVEEQESLMDIAYDFEDVIDDLLIRSAAKQRRRGHWERWILLIRIHKKLELIKSKISTLLLVVPVVLCSMESPMSSIHGQKLANRVVSPVEEKVLALRALKALHPDAKKARRVLDKFRSLDNDRGMAWMEELSHASVSIVVVIEDFINSNKHLRKRSWIRSSFGKSKSQHKLGVKMDKTYAKIQNLSKHGPQKDTQVQGQRRKLKSTTPILPQPTTQEPDFASFADNVHAMMTRLLVADKSFRVISIMAKLIFNNKAIVDHFSFRAWPSTTSSSTRGDSRQILLDIMKQLLTNKMMMQKLKAFLINNMSLIVMDEPPDYYFWDDLLTVLGDTSNRSRMIWITLKMSVSPNLKTMVDPHPLRLRVDEKSWALFTHALKINIPSEIQELKEKIVRRCEGLPLLIVKLAEALSQKDATIEEGSSTLQQLCHDQKRVWSNTLCRVNKDLSLYMMRCLFSRTLFPRDYDIPARRLITLWVAEDLVQTKGKNEALEDVAERFLNLLIAQGMVQVTKKKLNGNVETIRLPDALTSELYPGNDMIRRLVDHLDRDDITFDHIHGGYHTSSTSLTRYYQDVLSFRSFDTGRKIEPEEEIGNFLGRCISSNCFLLLWVLDLENLFKPKLPEALGKLTQLRYLGLRSTFFEKLPSSISKLRNLQTLDIKHTNIKTLLISICKFQQLKLMLRPSTGSLTTLQTLCGLFVNEKTPVRDDLNRLHNLRKLGLVMSSQPKAMSSQVQAVTDWVLNLKHLRSLRVKSIDDNNQPWDLELKPLTGYLNLSCIYLLGRLRNPSISELTEDPMQSLDKLPNLRTLKLFAKYYLGKSMHCSLGGFPQLRVLKLWKLDQLEEWKVEKGALQALRDLEIRYSERTPVLPEELLDRSPFLKIDVKPAQ